MKALVTGSTGFVGAAVTRCLLEHGVDVRVLVRRDSDLRNLEGLKVEQAYGDLRDVASLRQALAGCRHLYHVAALYALWAPDPQIFYDTNVTGTRNLMEAALDGGVERIVYTSTIGAIGLPPGGGPGTEDTPVSLEQMVGHYKRSKFLAEQEVRTLARAGLPVVIVNPSAPVGAHDIKPTPTGQVIVDFMKGRMPAYIETGMNLVDVDDVAVGHLLAMEKGRIGERYILGNRNLMLREVFAILSRLTGVPAPTLKLPRWSILPLAYANQWLADYVTHRPPRIPLEGVKMAKYVMHYDCSKADRKSTRLNSSHSQISYAVFCLKKKNKNNKYYVTEFSSKLDSDKITCCIASTKYAIMHFNINMCVALELRLPPGHVDLTESSYP